jgi:hypothetical protein
VSNGQWRAHFENLLAGFPEFIRQASRLESPNPEDDLYVKLAVVGFRQTARPEAWRRGHYEIIRDLRSGAYADDELTWYEESGEAVAQFACLFFGFLLGLDETGQLSERDREVAQALLPGFMLEDLERVARAASMGEGDA